MSKPTIYRRLVILVAATITGLLMAAGPAQAQRPTVPEQIQHYLECLDWLINNPAKHAELCGPGHPYFIENPKSSGSPPPDCYVPSAYVLVGRHGGYDDCPPPPPPPCDDGYGDVGFVLSTFGSDDCHEPCADKAAYVLTGSGYGDCGGYIPPCGGGGGSLPKALGPQEYFLAAGTHGGCPTTAPLAYEELRLFAI